MQVEYQENAPLDGSGAVAAPDSTLSVPVPPAPTPPDPLALTHRMMIVVDSLLDRGTAANRCLCLGTGLAASQPEIVGQDITTADGVVLPGFTKVPAAVLQNGSRPMADLVQRAWASGCTVIVYDARAQGMRSYPEYVEALELTRSEDLNIDAFAIYGPKKAVTKITGSLACLR